MCFIHVRLKGLEAKKYGPALLLGGSERGI
jgi:hypothetical protein